MRVFVVGASGVLGVRLVARLVGDGHSVAGTTRTPGKTPVIEALGARAVVADVYDADHLTEVVTGWEPEVVVDLLTDLPDDPARIPDLLEANSRIRREGTTNVIAAHRAAGASHLLVESVAWTIAGTGGEAVRVMEQMTLAAGGVVVRYGQFYGPGTFHPDAPPAGVRIHVDEAARRTASLLTAPSGVVRIVERSE